jgi:autotransporter-associated beta strand protein
LSRFALLLPGLNWMPKPGLLAILIALVPATSHAGSATWQVSPISNDWNTAANWMPNTVPNGPADVATFLLSNVNEVSVSANTTVSSIVTNSGGFTITASPGQRLSVSGSGIANNSGIFQNLVAAATPAGLFGTISFLNSATAGTQTLFTAEGSSADQAFGGRIQFFGSSSAGAGIFINEGSPPNSSFASGVTEFHDESTAGDGTFSNRSGGFGGGVTTFSESANAADANFTCEGGAANGAQGGFVIFSGASSASNGTFVADGPTAVDGYPGTVQFMGSSTADQGAFTLNGGTVSGEEGGNLQFSDSSTAADSLITVNGTDFSGANGGQINFLNSATAGNAIITLYGGAGGGGACAFGDDSDGGTAQIKVLGNSTVTVFNNSHSLLTLGSIEGDGSIILGSPFSVGSNNLSTVFSGVLSEHFPLTKVGAGTLTLTGANTYMGGTTVTSGTLKIDNTTGSGTGHGAVSVTAGTLGGSGIISGRVTIGTGSGPGAFLAPAVSTRVQATLTIQSALTFNADATYTYTFKAKRNRVRTDMVIANGVTINSGAMLALSGQMQGTLRQGLVLTLLSNTSANPISGAFSNLPDGGIVNINGNNFQASYEGGDGNDLTLTVVP